VRTVRADLHIHTALSPCASEEMVPPAIVKEALSKGLAMIAVCDHNAAGNVEAVMTAASMAAAAWRSTGAEVQKELMVIAGMEITTAEEVHVLGFFPSADAAAAAAAEVLDTLATLETTPRVASEAGGQPLFDGEGRIIGREERMLFSASKHSLAQTVALIRRNGGLAVASHVDRPSFSVLSQLGVFPEDVVFDALEISGVGVRAGRHRGFLSIGLPLVSSSDSHYLEDIGGGYTLLDIDQPAECGSPSEKRRSPFEELRLALRGDEGRRCSLA
jgi:3',5'-nucleoside bisphosphate phosphatase